jgi:hypothetical protein
MRAVSKPRIERRGRSFVLMVEDEEGIWRVRSRPTSYARAFQEQLALAPTRITPRPWLVGHPPESRSRRRAAGGGIPDVAGLVVWLDASSITGLADGDPITTWTDRSGKGNHATASGTARPLYKTNIQNGRSIARFDGLNDTMTVAGLGTDEFSGVTQGTLFAVFNPRLETPTGVGQYGIVDFNGASDGFWRFAGDGNGYFAVFRAARLFAQPTAQPFGNGWHQHTVRSGPASGYQVRRNKVLSVNTTTNWGIPADARVGFENVDNWLAGDIAEVLLYTRELPDPEVTYIENYLSGRWGPYS